MTSTPENPLPVVPPLSEQRLRSLLYHGVSLREIGRMHALHPWMGRLVARVLGIPTKGAEAYNLDRVVKALEEGFTVTEVAAWRGISAQAIREQRYKHDLPSTPDEAKAKAHKRKQAQQADAQAAAKARQLELEA
jgi:hypothetical protein